MRERGRRGGEESKESKEGPGLALMTDFCYAFHLSSFHQIPFLFCSRNAGDAMRCRSLISFVVFCSNWIGFTGISWSRSTWPYVTTENMLVLLDDDDSQRDGIEPSRSSSSDTDSDRTSKDGTEHRIAIEAELAVMSRRSRGI